MDVRAAIEEIAANNRSGAVALAERGAAVLAAAAGAPGADLEAVAMALARAQPAMAPLLRLANTALLAADAHPADRAAAAREAAAQFVADLRAHSSQAAQKGAVLAQGARVLTHSASSLVAQALLEAHRSKTPVREVICTESRPALEGIGLARTLGEAGLRVRVIADAAAAAVLPRCDAVLLGADSVCAAGLVHKVGTLGLAICARHHGVAVYALATDEKLLPLACGPRPPIPERPAAELLPAPATGVAALNFAFDVTPRHSLTGVVTEGGLLRDEVLTARLQAIPVHASLRGVWEGPGPEDPLLP